MLSRTLLSPGTDPVYRDVAAAALERAARLEEENHALRQHLHAFISRPQVPPPSRPSQGVVIALAVGVFLAVLGGSLALFSVTRVEHRRTITHHAGPEAVPAPLSRSLHP
jgi:hypothetical protein